MTSFDQKESEIEIAHCIAALRNIIETTEVEHIFDLIMSGTGRIHSDAEKKRRVLFYMRKKNAVAFKGETM